MKNIWVLVETGREGEIDKASPGLLAEARRLAGEVGGNVTALLFRPAAGEIPAALWEYGVSRTLVFQDPLFARFSADAYAAALLPYLEREKPWLFLLAHTAIGKELAPYLAVKLDTGLVTGGVKIDAADPAKPLFYRPVYGGQLWQEIELKTDGVMLVTMDAKAVNAIPAPGPVEIKTTVIKSSLPYDIIKTQHIEYQPADFQTVDVAEAGTIVAAGMGAATGDLLPLVAELAHLVEGALGTTRPVVDGGKIPRERLIGQTGKTVSPDFYLALGVSGATHHTGGIQASKRIVAVNLDPQAPIFRSADAAAVADLREVLPELIERIKKAKADGEIL